MKTQKKTRTRDEHKAISEANITYKQAQAAVLVLRSDVAMAQARVSQARVEALNKRTELEESVAARHKCKAMLDALRS